jgi:hypothetical protein
LACSANNLKIMTEIILDAFWDSIRMIPLLLIVYILIELFEYKFGDKIRQSVQKAGRLGPAIGALVGSLPQCGFSVIGAALYTQRLVTTGTLMAVFLSTSDEALPIILSQPEKIEIILPLILTKIFIALVAGYSLDFIFRKKNKEILQHIKAFEKGEDDKNHHHESVTEERGCCGHSTNSESKKFSFKEIFLHPLIHTFKIFIFIFLVSALINFLVDGMGNNVFENFVSGHKLLQPFLVTLIGLIPNCAASVAITELYLKGIISYGSVIAGLSASGGLGILVLLKEEKQRKNAIFVITLLFAISVASGLIINIF